ncbi:unnamed protein product, partial [Symbiodinium sp. CCMP2456]
LCAGLRLEHERPSGVDSGALHVSERLSFHPRARFCRLASALLCGPGWQPHAGGEPFGATSRGEQLQHQVRQALQLPFQDERPVDLRGADEQRRLPSADRRQGRPSRG